jgi:hypothetical protein
MMAAGNVVISTLGKFSEKPEENARQTGELEKRLTQALKNAESRIADLESRVVALEQYNVDNP